MGNSAKVKVGAVAATVAALTVGLAGPAFADQQPRSTDVVGVGSDTVQYVANFVDDGSPNGLAGYNALNTARRVWSFDATADAAGRTAYKNGTSTALDSQVVLRAGTNPVARPNGSGSGIAALLADANHRIDFVRSSRLPTAAEQTTAAGTAGFGAGIHVFRIATDGLEIAVNNAATNAPVGLSAAELVNIYNGTWTTWGQIPGYTGSAPTNTIIPVIPQSGSGTRNDFLNDLKAANGGVAITLGANVKVAEEHDPAGITGQSAPADAIEPFSVGRYNLIQTGYLGTSAPANAVKLLTGTAPDASAAYVLNRSLYILVRDADVNSTTPMQVGGTLNFVKTLFGTSTSFYAKAANSGLFTAAGVTQSWADLGLASG